MGLTTEFPLPTASITDLAGLNGEPVAGRYIIRAIDTDTSNTGGTRVLKSVALKVTRQADDAWRLRSNLVVDGTADPGLSTGDDEAGTALLPVGEGAPKHCTEAIEGETFYDRRSHGLRVCDGQYWRATSGVCGNGIIEGGEECDSDAIDGSRCNTACVLVSFTCAQECTKANSIGFLDANSVSNTPSNFNGNTSKDSEMLDDFYVSRTAVYRNIDGTWQSQPALSAGSEPQQFWSSYSPS